MGRTLLAPTADVPPGDTFPVVTGSPKELFVPSIGSSHFLSREACPLASTDKDVRPGGPQPA